MDFSGKHIVVTGGGSGVGAEIARQFSAKGANVTVFGRRQAPLNDVAGEIDASAFTCDVTERPSLDAALAQARAKYGPVNIAIANAGAAHSLPFGEMTADDLDTMLAVNLVGVFNIWQACLPDMIAANAGRLIAIASTAGLKGYPYVSGYAAAKHGVVGLTRSLALELARTGVTVNAICPGFVETPLLTRSIETITAKTGLSAQEAASRLMASNPQGRFVQVSEVAACALWIAGDDAGSLNGHALPLAGGEI